MYEETFGLVFGGLLIASTLYAIGRTVYERWIKTAHAEAEPGPTGIPFHHAVRLANSAYAQRYNRERDTEIIAKVRDSDETPAGGVSTVDLQARREAGAHRQRYVGKARVQSAPEAA